MATRTLQVVIAGDAKGLQQALGSADGALGSFGAKLGGIGKLAAVGLGAAAAAAGAVGVGLFKIGSTFDDAFDKIRVGTGATGDALAGLQESFKNVAANTPASFGEVSTAIADLNTRLGLTGEPLEQLADQFLNLSRITDTDVGANIENITRLFGDWGVAVDDQSGAMDMLFRASQATGAGIDQLSQQAVQFGAPLRQMGFGFEESIALLGKFEKEGVNTELVMGSMRQALGRFARAGESAPEAMRRLTDEIKNMEDPTAATALAMEMFGARAGPDMAAAIREGRFDLGELFDTITNGTETINGAAEDTADFAEQWAILKNKVLVALEPIATRVFSAVGDAMAKIMPYVDKVLAAFDEGGLSAAFAAVGDALEEAWPSIRAALGNMAEAFWEWVQQVTPPLLRALGDLLRRVGLWIWNTGLPWLRERLARWTEAFFAWATEAGPPALRELGRLLGRLGEWILDEGLPLLLEKLVEWGRAFAEWVGPMIGPLLVELGKLIVEVNKWIVTEALPKLASKLLEWSKAFWSWVWNDALPALLRALGDLGVAVLRWVGQKAIELGVKLGEWVREVVGWPGRAVFELAANLEGLAAGILGWVERLPTRIGLAARGMWDGIYEAFRGALNRVIRGWNSLEFKLPSFAGLKVAGQTVIPGWEGPTLGTPDIPTMHAGGMFRAPRPGGEGLALLRDGEFVSSAAHASSGPTTVVLELDRRQLGAAVIDSLVEAGRSRGAITLPIRVGSV